MCSFELATRMVKDVLVSNILLSFTHPYVYKKNLQNPKINYIFSDYSFFEKIQVLFANAAINTDYYFPANAPPRERLQKYLFLLA